jgi:CRP/FNR family transcriptional regulator
MSALKRDGVIELEEKRRIVVPNFDMLSDETGDDTDGGMLA